MDITAFSENLLWLKVKYTPSIMHRLVAFFYKPEIIYMRVGLEDGTDKNFRLVGGNLNEGFLLNPLLEGNAALENFLVDHKVRTRINNFTITMVEGNAPYSTKEFDIEVSSLTSEAAHK